MCKIKKKSKCEFTNCSNCTIRIPGVMVVFSMSFSCFLFIFFAKNRILNIRKILQFFFVYNTICFLYLYAETKNCISKELNLFYPWKWRRKEKFSNKKSLVSFTFTWCYIWIWGIVKNYYLNATLWRKYCQHSKFEGLNGSFFNPSNIHIGHSVCKI